MQKLSSSPASYFLNTDRVSWGKETIHAFPKIFYELFNMCELCGPAELKTSVLLRTTSAESSECFLFLLFYPIHSYISWTNLQYVLIESGVSYLTSIRKLFQPDVKITHNCYLTGQIRCQLPSSTTTSLLSAIIWKRMSGLSFTPMSHAEKLQSVKKMKQ